MMTCKKSVAPPLLFMATGLVFLPFYQYNLNPDATSYISIARSYASGNFVDAVNTYWSPLVSFLLALFIKLQIHELFAFRLILICAGALSYSAGIGLLQKFFLQKNTLVIASITLFVLLQSWVYLIYSPDLLTLPLWLLPIRLLTNNNAIHTKKTIWLAAIGALLFMTKAYAFVFYPVFIALVFTYKKLSHKLLLFIPLYLLFCSVWLIPLYLKSGKLTIGRSGQINLAMALVSQSADHPLFFDGLKEPQTSSAISPWETPDSYHYPSLSFSNLTATSLILNFFKQLVSFTKDFAHYGIVIIILFALYLWRFKQLPNIPVAGIFLVVYPAGYFVSWSLERYLWPEIFVLILIGFICFDRIIRLISNTLIQLLLTSALVFSILIVPCHRMSAQFEKGERFHSFAKALSKLQKSDSELRIASDPALFSYGLFSAYLNNDKYLSIPKRNNTESQLLNELNKHRIGCYLSETAVITLQQQWHETLININNSGTCFVYLK